VTSEPITLSRGEDGVKLRPGVDPIAWTG